MTQQLQHYLQAWGLADPQPLAQTATSHVYTVQAGGQQAVLKLLTDVGVADEQPGALALRCFEGRGAVRLLRHDEQAHLLEYAAGPDLIPLVQQGRDTEATQIIADVLNSLHAAHTDRPPAGLWPLPMRFRSLFRKAAVDKKAGLNSVYMRTAPLAESLLASPREQRVLHGDIHHGNIRHSPRGWLAFDPKGLYGERTYDAANTLLNPVSLPQIVADAARLLHNAELLARELHIELPRLLAFVLAYACLSAAWSLEDGDDPTLALRVAGIVAPHVRADGL